MACVLERQTEISCRPGKTQLFFISFPLYQIPNLKWVSVWSMGILNSKLRPMTFFTADLRAMPKSQIKSIWYRPLTLNSLICLEFYYSFKIKSESSFIKDFRVLKLQIWNHIVNEETTSYFGVNLRFQKLSKVWFIKIRTTHYM